MAKKPPKSDRQAVIDDIRKKQSGAERRRGLAIVGVCVVIAALIVGIPVFSILKDKVDQGQYDDVATADIGSPASVCQPLVTKEATGNQQHVAEGTDITYTDAPPAFGQHYYSPDPIGRKFYAAADRPALGTLVHNLEHGYTILWYDQTAADNGAWMDEIRAIASKFPSSTDLRDKFKAVPWLPSDEDGNSFPSGQHIAFTHWSAGGSGVTEVSKQKGVWQYCSAPSGAALTTFMSDYPYTDSPEPGTP